MRGRRSFSKASRFGPGGFSGWVERQLGEESPVGRYFGFRRLGTNWKREVLAGTTTFFTMAYIVAVNPGILAGAVSASFGISLPEARMAMVVPTILTAFIGTLLMGLYGRRPFGLAPYMGENAFIAFTVVGTGLTGLGFTYQEALSAILIGGVLFVLLTLFRLRSWLAEAIPTNLKHAFVVGIGLFLTMIGLKEIGFIKEGMAGGAPIALGNVQSASVLLGLFGFLLMGVLMLRRVTGAILISILATTALAFVVRVAPFPDRLVSLPPNPAPLLFCMSFKKVFTFGFFPVLLVVFVMDFVDTMGTLIGVSARAGFLNRKGDLPGLEKPLLADAISTVVAAVVGTTTAGTFIESASGIEEGGRSGFTAVVTSLWFLSLLFFAPLVAAIPHFAWAPALIMVGILMMKSVTNLDFDDFTELIPAFGTIILMAFTYNLGVGMTAGFVLYPLVKLLAGRRREVKPGMWALGGASLLFYIAYPYG